MSSNTAAVDLAATVAASQAAVSSLVDAVRAGQLRFQCHDDLSVLVSSVRALQARLESVALAAVREVDTRRSHHDDGALSTAAWLRMHTRMTPTQATGAVRTARVLGSGELPGTAAALADGAIDPAHVQAIAAGVADAPAGAAALIEDEALAAARAADPRIVRALMARFAHALDPDGADQAALRRLERRGLTLVVMGDGTVFLRGQADETNGAILQTAIDANIPLVPGESRTAAQRRLDALVDIARRYLASPDAPSAGGGHAHLIVTLDGADLTDPNQATDDQCADHTDDAGPHHPDAGEPAPADSATTTPPTGLTGTPAPNDGTGWSGWSGWAGWAGPAGTTNAFGSGERTTGRGAGPGGTLSWVGPITASTARRIGCDADVTYVRIDPAGATEVVGREQRFFTWTQKKAMISRDGDRCCVPYCDRPVAWGDGHHIRHWANGGPTIISNGAIPCAAHHPMFHEGGWTLHRQPDGRYTIRRRDGKTIGPEPYPPGHNRPPPPATRG